jgi:fatty-acyl-CoA synthase
VPVNLPLPRRVSQLAAFRREVAERIDFAGCSMVAVDDNLLAVVDASLPAPAIVCSRLLSESDGAPPPTVDGDDVAYLQFTSGTTGKSRAVTLTHRQILTNVAATLAHMRPDLTGRPDADVAEWLHVSWLPLFHDMGLMTVVGAVFIDRQLVLQPPEEFLRAPYSWLDALSHYRATTTWAPNFAYAIAARGLASRPQQLDLSHLQVAGNGAESIDVDTMTKFTAEGTRHGLRPEVGMAMYGLAEATVAVCLGDVGAPICTDVVSRMALEQQRVATPAEHGSPDAKTLVVCGHPIADVELAIIDERTGERVEDRVVGEICVRGPSVMQGYWRSPEETDAALHDGWLHTGDLGYLIPSGLVVCGRIKDMIIVAGRNVYPEDYEQVANAVPGVRCSATFAMRDAEQMAVVIEPDNARLDPNQLGRTVMAELARQVGVAPHAVVVVKRGAIPVTSSGKIRRGHCRELYADGSFPVLADVSDYL